MLVIQTGNNQKFSMKNPKKLLILRILVMQDFDCNGISCPFVNPAEHATKPTNPDFTNDLVRADLGWDVRRRFCLDRAQRY